jgi:hypothetical protein
VNLSRATSAALISACLVTLSACGEESTTAGTPPTTAGSVAAPAVTSVAPSAATGTATGGDDRAVCQAADKAGKDLKEAFVTAMTSGKTPSNAQLKTILTGFGSSLTTVTASAADSTVVAAAKQVAEQATKAAAAADPAEAAATPAFEKASTDLAAACKAIGVPLEL